MARQRDYAAEYRRRVERARELGYRSYHHRRRTEEDAQFYEGRSREEFMRIARNPPADLTPAQVRLLWAEGDQAMRSGDFEEAEDIARQLGYRSSPKRPPQRIFWYH